MTNLPSTLPLRSPRQAPPRGLLRAQRGSTSAMMAAAFIPVLLAMGGGVDLGRAYVVQSQLQTAVDAAALAAAQSCKTKNSGTGVVADPVDAQTQADAYFNENFNNGYMGTTGRDLVEDELCTGASFMRVALTGKATMPYSIMRIAGLTTKAIEAKAVAETGSNPSTIEAVLVLDVTGSMSQTLGSTTRIESLKNAAKDFIDIVYQNKETEPGIALGFVPYNILVNPGTFATGKLGTLVENVPGFTDQTGALDWAGCVQNDQTIQNMSNDIYTQDAGAWDIRKEMRGFGNGSAPRLKPFLYHPTWVRQTMTANANPTNIYWDHVSTLGTGGFEDNRYVLSADPITNTNLANSAAYRQFFFDRFIDLNDTAANIANHVVVRDDDSFYAKGSPASVKWKIRPEKIPNVASVADYKPVAAYGIATRTARGPNSQCPSPIRPMAYGRTRTADRSWIDTNIAAFTPGAGTIHHTGALWGYRMLQNTAAFPRTNPTAKQAKRIMLFMTDGNYELNLWSNDTNVRNRWNDAMPSTYGSLKEQRLRASTDPAQIRTASALRFSKICQAMKDEGAAVYVVALAIDDPVSDTMFSQCAPGDKYKKAASDEQLREAFRSIAREVIDLHIVS